MDPLHARMGLVGNWSTSITSDGAPLALELHIISQSVAMITVDKTLLPQPLTLVPGATLEHICFEVPEEKVRFAGVLSGEEIVGCWTQFGRDSPLSWKRCTKQLPEQEGVMSLSSASSQPAAASDYPFVGDWESSIMSDGEPLRICFHLRSKDLGWLDSPEDPSRSDVVIRSGVAPNELRFEVPSEGTRFRGCMTGDTITGTWTANGNDVDLTWKRKVEEPQAHPIVGLWSAVFRSGGMELALKLEAQSTSRLSLTSVDQSPAPFLAVLLPSAQPDQVHLDFPPVNASFRGAWRGTQANPHERIEGVFTQNGLDTPLVWTRGEPVVLDTTRFTQAAIRALHCKSSVPALTAGVCCLDGTRAVLCEGNRVTAQVCPVSLDDCWHIGSMTKSFTATLAARLVEQGHLTWQASVGELLGGLLPAIHDAYKGMTLLHLLSHRARLQANLPPEDFAKFSRHLVDARKERLEWARLALAAEPQPDEYLYSNSGFIVAGAMLEVKMGAPWEELLHLHVCAPLGLSSVGFGAPGVHDGNAAQPAGHAPSAGGRLRAHLPKREVITDNPAALGPAGTIHITMTDLLTYLCAHRDCPPAFLSAAAWHTLHTPPFGGDYALGWVVRKNGNLWHNGCNTLWYSEMVINSKSGRVAAAVTNCTAPDANKIVHSAIWIALEGSLSEG